MKFNKLVPELSVSNIKKSLHFYTKLLGFKIEYSRPEDKFYFLSLEGSQIMIEEVGKKWFPGRLIKPFGRGVNFQIETRNMEKIIHALKTHNYPIFIKPRDRQYRKGKTILLYGEFLVQDPDGYILR